MGRFSNILKSGGGTLGRLVTGLIGMFAGKVITDQMTKKILKQQTGFESTDEIMADARARAEKAQADAEAQARAAQQGTSEP